MNGNNWSKEHYQPVFPEAVSPVITMAWSSCFPVIDLNTYSVKAYLYFKDKINGRVVNRSKDDLKFLNLNHRCVWVQCVWQTESQDIFLKILTHEEAVRRRYDGVDTEKWLMGYKKLASWRGSKKVESVQHKSVSCHYWGNKSNEGQSDKRHEAYIASGLQAWFWNSKEMLMRMTASHHLFQPKNSFFWQSFVSFVSSRNIFFSSEHVIILSFDLTRTSQVSMCPSNSCLDDEVGWQRQSCSAEKHLQDDLRCRLVRKRKEEGLRASWFAMRCCVTPLTQYVLLETLQRLMKREKEGDQLLEVK